MSATYDHDSTQVPVDPDTWFKDVSVVPTQMQYNPLGQMTAITRPNDIDSSYIYGDASIAVDVSRNQNPYQVYSIVHEDTETTPVTLGQYDYSYDAAGNRSGMNITASDGSQTNISYDYDRANRLIEESYLLIGGVTSSTDYRYDRAGNRSQMTDSSGDITQYIYDNNDQLTRVNLPNFYYEDYSYDARGNLTLVESSGHATYSATNYAYNARDQLVSFGIGAATAVTYDYDHNNNRVEQNISGTATDYLWDEFSRFGDVILETDPNNPLDIVSYTLASGMLISQNNNGNVDYFLQDAQGSTIGIADDTGTVTSTYSYNAFGELDDSSTLETNYLYTGQQYDPSTELYSLRSRYYDPSNGRFITRDTWAYNYDNPFELNRYAYAANNPATFTDPSGHFVNLATYMINTTMGGSGRVAATYTLGHAVADLVIIAVLGLLYATMPDIRDIPESVEVDAEGLIRAVQEYLRRNSGNGNGDGSGGGNGRGKGLLAGITVGLITSSIAIRLLCVLFCPKGNQDPRPAPTEDLATATPTQPAITPTPDNESCPTSYGAGTSEQFDRRREGYDLKCNLKGHTATSFTATGVNWDVYFGYPTDLSFVDWFRSGVDGAYVGKESSAGGQEPVVINGQRDFVTLQYGWLYSQRPGGGKQLTRADIMLLAVHELRHAAQHRGGAGQSCSSFTRGSGEIDAFSFTNSWAETAIAEGKLTPSDFSSEIYSFYVGVGAAEVETRYRGAYGASYDEAAFTCN